MRAGDLDRRITIERLVPGRDAANAQTETWAPVVTNWPAAKTDLSDRERLAAAEIGADITTRFRIRYSSEVAGVTPKDRIVCDGRTYDIAAVREIGRREGLEMTGTARADG